MEIKNKKSFGLNPFVFFKPQIWKNRHKVRLIKPNLSNKKGMFFTILAIIVLSLFLLSYTVYNFSLERKIINKRIETMNNYIFSMDKDLERQIYISSFRIIFLFEKYIIDNGKPISNLNNTVTECFINGTVYNINQPLMEDAKFSYIQDILNVRAGKVNIRINLSSPNITFTQEDPWNVKVIFTVKLIANDVKNIALWNRTETIVTYVPITYFEDPLYILGTNGLMSNKINKTTYKPFTSENNVYNLTLHTKNSLYINSSSAPSFLYRLQGNNNASEFGIESLVNLEKLSNIYSIVGKVVEEKSCVDYIYFSNNNPDYRRINGMDSWFRLDDNHLEIYNVSGLSI